MCVSIFEEPPVRPKRIAETAHRYVQAPKTAREVALRVLAEVPASECEEAARRVAETILREAQNCLCANEYSRKARRYGKALVGRG